MPADPSAACPPLQSHGRGGASDVRQHNAGADGVGSPSRGTRRQCCTRLHAGCVEPPDCFPASSPGEPDSPSALTSALPQMTPSAPHSLSCFACSGWWGGGGEAVGRLTFSKGNPQMCCPRPCCPQPCRPHASAASTLRQASSTGETAGAPGPPAHLLGLGHAEPDTDRLVRHTLQLLDQALHPGLHANAHARHACEGGGQAAGGLGLNPAAPGVCRAVAPPSACGCQQTQPTTARRKDCPELPTRWLLNRQPMAP